MNSDLRGEILALARRYVEEQPVQEFVPGETYIPVTGKVVEADDCEALVDASLDMWLTAGRFATRLEHELARKWGTRYCRLTVSGSSANLLAFATFTSPMVEPNRRIEPGSEVITVAAGFPTTVNPIVQYGCIPVFVDVDLDTCNADADLLEDALTDKTRAVMLAHTLGNPFDVGRIAKFCKDNDLVLIEDCCDAFGATFSGQHVGTFGDAATVSFYPAHHMTMGEGGAVFVDELKLARVTESFRDWGRDCYCLPGCDNTCKNRFGWQLGSLPAGYDHKYTYSHIGYNMKVTDMQAAIGLSQLAKIDRFVDRRRENFALLTEALIRAELDEVFHLPQPTPNSNPSWFGYLLVIRDDACLSRREVVEHLEDRRIGTRLLFAGNLTRQPSFADVEYRIHGELAVTDKVMADGFWLGVWPMIDAARIDYMVDSLRSVVDELR